MAVLQGIVAPRSQILVEKRIIAICFFIALAQFQYGYDSAAIAGFQSMPGFLEVFGYVDPTNPIGFNISTDVQRLIQSLMNVGGFVSALIIVVYMTEASPALLRGPIVGMTTFQTSLGALFGILVDYYTNLYYGGHRSWQIPLAVMYIVPGFLTIFLLFLPDTPRYYVMRDEDDKALQAIRRLRGIEDEALLRAEVEDIRNTYEIEKELHAGVHLRDMFRGTDLRRTILCYGTTIGGTATGVTFMAGFSVYLFVQANVGSPFVWVMISLAIALTGNMLAFPAMRMFGRRELLVVCSIISSATMFGMAIVYTVSGPGQSGASKALVALSIIFTWVYGVGQGPVMWALSTEIPSQRLRSQTLGTATGLNFITGWLTAFFTPYFINPDKLNWGPKYGYIWGASNLILAVWTFFFVPETKGRSLEQLDELFEKSIGARKFSSFAVERQLVDGTTTRPPGAPAALHTSPGDEKGVLSLVEVEDPEKRGEDTQPRYH